MGCNASKLPPNSVVEVPKSVAPRASANEDNSPAKAMSDESFLNKLDNCLDHSFESTKEDSCFNSSVSSKIKETSIGKPEKIESISISPVRSQTSLMSESLNSFDTKALYEETKHTRQEDTEKQIFSPSYASINSPQHITQKIKFETAQEEKKNVPFPNLQRGISIIDLPTPPRSVKIMSEKNMYTSSPLKYKDKDVEQILESTIRSARKIQRRAEEYLSSSHLDVVQIKFDQIGTITKNSIRKPKGHSRATKLDTLSDVSCIKNIAASEAMNQGSSRVSYIEKRVKSKAEEQLKQHYVDDCKASDLSIVSKASPYTPKHPSKKLRRVLGNLIADDNCMATRISNAREKYLKERQKRIRMEKMISASSYFSPKSRIRKTSHSYLGKSNLTLHEFR